MKNILILGGSYGGLGLAHQILKQAAKMDHFKITIVCPNTHLYWNMASPRGVIPGQLADEKLFQPIAAGFKHYPASRFELIKAYAESVDVDAKTVQIVDAKGTKTLAYDFLVLATGTHTKGKTPFKMLDSTEATKDALHDFQGRVTKAKKIVIAGAGLTGVEVAGEIAFVYGRNKEIVLIASGPTVLQGSPANVSKIALKELQNLKVSVKLQTKVTASAELSEGQQEITLSDGDTITADMYIPMFGLKPNSSYLPAHLLNADGLVMVDEHLRVKGTDDVWAIGDISDIERAQYKAAVTQSAHLAKSITSILANKASFPYKVPTPLIGLSIGRKAGTGHYGTMRIPSFVIVMARKNLFIDNMVPTVDGTLF